jgi:hypothetical protein
MTPDPPTPSAPATSTKSGSAQPQAAPSAKSTNAQAQAKRTPAASPSTVGQPHQPAAASVGRPRVVAPVPYVPSQAPED